MNNAFPKLTAAEEAELRIKYLHQAGESDGVMLAVYMVPACYRKQQEFNLKGDAL